MKLLKNIYFVVACIIAAVFILIGFSNTIFQLIGSVAAYIIWIAYFFAIGIIYEIIARSYLLFKKIKKDRIR